MLSSNGDPDLGHQAADLNGLDLPYQLIPSADAPDFLPALVLGFASRSEE